MAFEHTQIRSLDDREIDQVEGGLSPVTLGVAAAVVGVWVAAFQAGYGPSMRRLWPQGFPARIGAALARLAAPPAFSPQSSPFGAPSRRA
jgi:lactobin A/cerein 7B family class IIb bacteriocin